MGKLIKPIGRCDGTGVRPTQIDIESRKVGEWDWQYKCPKCNRWIKEDRHGNLAAHNKHDPKGSD